MEHVASRKVVGGVAASALIAAIGAFGVPAVITQTAWADDASSSVSTNSASSKSVQTLLSEAYGTAVNVEYEDGLYNVYDDDVTFFDYWADRGGFLVLEYSEGDTAPLATGTRVVIDEAKAADGIPAYEVVQAIQSLPVFTGDNASTVLAALDKAQKQYDALTATQKKLVTNYSNIRNTRQMIYQVQAEETAAKKNATAKKKAKAVKVTGVKVKAGKKKATVSWKKKSGYKYQVWYKKPGAKKAKTVKTSSTKKVIKKLASKKKYTFKVRTYKKIGGTTVYGKWSASKTVKVK